MQVTLVSHFGAKPAPLAALIARCRETVATHLGEAFRPYAPDQVHATIIGLEGHRVGDRVDNRNSRDLGDPRSVTPGDLLSFLRDDLPCIEVRIGGYRADTDYGFESRGLHPYHRSFGIRGGIAVAMGWPVEGDRHSVALDELRRQFRHRLGIRHKWHRTEHDVDNDFFLVLGRIDGNPAPGLVGGAERGVRDLLRDSGSVSVLVGPETLKVVAYDDERLPVETSIAFRVDDGTFGASRLLDLYPLRAGCDRA